MEALTVPLDEARELFVAQAAEFLAACEALSDLELLDPSRCRGWSRLDLLVHVRAGLDEMAADLATPSTAPPDHDAAGYWGSHPDDRDEDVVPHVMWLRRTASAYGRPRAAVRHLADSTGRAVAAVTSAAEAPSPSRTRC
ncbi:maleylpyruvate isomerase N-terminal domain-containing protein [Cellulomonas sp. DKR-3]|uniref:Maleylpyruvate isomerase N-terminal domain-containing protein n=1 Tax=Cellulomonas fulva TaxID=2835530 RepID=A0ABS5TW78_9CELL|nr:maleylpyruvate isomerase N-terminal domain-containing protein [Cellulomonas fulva]MBT0993366.1 maleylpyruvate isomerase N-terminal domain-containing protein [Cellulomonas fulva]